MTASIDAWVSAISDAVKDSHYQNNTKQLHARALSQELAPGRHVADWKYDQRALLRSLTASTLGLERLALEKPDSTESVREVIYQLGRSWESMAKIGEGVEVEMALLNASTLYELAGYQANAVCLARKLNERMLKLPERDSRRMLVYFLERLFVKLRILTNGFTQASIGNSATDHCKSDPALSSALRDAVDFFLTGNTDSYEKAVESVRAALSTLLSEGYVVEASLARSVLGILSVMRDRSIWNILRGEMDNPRWLRYLKLLARGTGRHIDECSSVSELWPSQMNAIAGGLFRQPFASIVKMPTSAGKTRTAEMVIARTLIEDSTAKCVYVAPWRALVSELEESFLRMFSDLGFSVTSLMGNYESDESQESLIVESNLVITTPEKLDLLLRLRPEFLDRVRLVVLDEVQILMESDRAVKYELLMTRIKRRLPQARFLLLSAVVPDSMLQVVSRWLNSGKGEEVLLSKWRPALQRAAIFHWVGIKGENGEVKYYPHADDLLPPDAFVPRVAVSKQYEYVNPDTGRINRRIFPEPDQKAEVAAELAYTFATNGPVLVFCSQPSFVNAVGKAIKKRMDLGELAGETRPDVFQPKETRTSLIATEWLGQDHLATALLNYGVGLHHGELPDSIRKSVEMDFRERRLAILVATNTLAQGVNLPIRTAIIHSCWRHEGGQPRRVSAQDYWNIAGRAGRPGYETEGTIVHITLIGRDELDFAYYLAQRENMEGPKSVLFQKLVDLIANRIQSDDVLKLVDPEVLALLVEEVGQSKDALELDQFLSATLTSYEAAEAGLDMQPLRQIVSTKAKEIISDTPDGGTRRVFSSTGLSFSSCKQIQAYVNNNASHLQRFLTSQDMSSAFSLAALALRLLQELSEMNPDMNVTVNSVDVLKLWLNGERVDEIRRKTSPSVSVDRLARFIEVQFGRLIPWGISSLIRIAMKELKLEDSDISNHAMYFGGMVKYGVPSAEASWAMMLGIPVRDLAIRISNNYRLSHPSSSFADFRNWIAGIDSDTFRREYGVRSPVLEDVVNAVSIRAPNPLLAQYASAADMLPDDCVIRGLTWEESRMRAADDLEVGQSLVLERDYENAYDWNAVLVKFRGAVLGYLPRNLAQVVAPDIDSGLELTATVTGKEAGTSPVVRIRVSLSHPT